MKKNELTMKLSSYGCFLKRNGTNHEWWYSPITKMGFAVPRHGAKEISTSTLKSIEKVSGIKLS